jgi:hypothetical protein
MGRLIIGHAADLAIWLPAVSVDTVTNRVQAMTKWLLNVPRLWPLADIPIVASDIRFRG